MMTKKLEESDEKMKLEYLDEQLFTASRWRSGTPADLLIQCRTQSISKNRHTLKAHAVGYCDAEKLLCRPKNEHKAVMFFKDDIHFWFHVTNREFEVINAA